MKANFCIVELLSFLFCITIVGLTPNIAHAETRSIIFPVLGGASYSNDFGNARSGGRTHEGNDLFAPKLTKLVAVVDGTVQYVAYPEPSWGYGIFLNDEAGYQYRYLHVNNDAPGTDDGVGGGMNAYAPNVESGANVLAGQIIGYVGDSGNAEQTSPHLHFEIRRPDGNPINPYESLQASTIISNPEPAAVQDNEILPFGEVPIGSAIAYGDVDGDGTDELIIGAGKGGGPQVQIYSQSGNVLGSFFAYDESFRGGIDVATGDTNGDGKDEIITAAGEGGGPHIRIFNQQGNVQGEFFAYGEAFRGGVRIATADLNGNGKAAIITVPASEAKAKVRIFNAAGKRLRAFRAYSASFTVGADVAAISASEDSSAYIITAPNVGGGPHVQVFSRRGKLQSQFMVYDEAFHGGVRVAAGNILSSNSGEELVVAPASDGSADVRVLSVFGDVLQYEEEYEEWWRAGFDVAATESTVALGIDGDRRASVRTINVRSGGRRTTTDSTTQLLKAYYNNYYRNY